MARRGALAFLWLASVGAALLLGMRLGPEQPEARSSRGSVPDLELRRHIADLEWERSRPAPATRPEGPVVSRDARRPRDRPRRGGERTIDSQHRKIAQLATELVLVQVDDGSGGFAALRHLWASELKMNTEAAQYTAFFDLRDAFALAEELLRNADDATLLDRLGRPRVAEFFDELLRVMEKSTRDPGGRARWAELAQATAAADMLSAEARNTLAGWRPGPAAEQDLLRRIEADPSSAVRLVAKLAPSTAASLDLTRLLEPAVEIGNYQVFQVVRHVGAEVKLDDAFLRALGNRDYGPGAIWRHLLATGRRDWRAARPFVERGLRLDGTAGATFAYGVSLLADPPPREFVLAAAESPAHSEVVRAQLRKYFDID